jgi:hypothetical protein
VRAKDVEGYQRELGAARNQAIEQVRAAEVRAGEQVNQFRSAYPAKL